MYAYVCVCDYRVSTQPLFIGSLYLVSLSSLTSLEKGYLGVMSADLRTVRWVCSR